MGQNLSNGVYLPDEGEHNCYSGLAANWNILNTAVGNIAGKASSSHTHGNITNDGKVGATANLPLITGTGGAVQAGSFGTSANTFCEGNDSRLSDARTPVAHTHTKSDVTDLFNSANVWAGTQTYGAYLKSFGEARADEWSGNSRTNAYLLSRRDTDDVSGFLISTFRQNAAQGTAGHVYGWDILENSTRYSGLRFTIDWDSTLNSGSGAYRVTLGTNTQGTNPCNDLHITQLKTINGITPGALSLPNVRAAVADPIDTNGWNLTGSRNKYTPTEDGWIYIRVAGTGSCAINIHNGDTDNNYPTWFNTSTGGYATLVVPCEKGISLYIYISATSIEYCSFHPCLGNV